MVNVKQGSCKYQLFKSFVLTRVGKRTQVYRLRGRRSKTRPRAIFTECEPNTFFLLKQNPCTHFSGRNRHSVEFVRRTQKLKPRVGFSSKLSKSKFLIFKLLPLQNLGCAPEPFVYGKIRLQN